MWVRSKMKRNVCRSEKGKEKRQSRSQVPQGGRARKPAVLAFIHRTDQLGFLCRSIRECTLGRAQIRAQIPSGDPRAANRRGWDNRCNIVVHPPVGPHDIPAQHLSSSPSLFLLSPNRVLFVIPSSAPPPWVLGRTRSGRVKEARTAGCGADPHTTVYAVRRKIPK